MRETIAGTYVLEERVGPLDHLSDVPFQFSDSPAFIAGLMGFTAILEGSLPIRITRPDNQITTVQPADESLVMVGGRLVAMAIYTGGKSNPRILRGSI